MALRPSEIGLIQLVLDENRQIPTAQRKELAAAFRAAHGPKPEGTRIEFASIVSARDGEGKVEMMVNTETVQLDLAKAREVRGMLDGAIEAAVSDGLLRRFLIDRVGMTAETAARALVDFREMRQGSRSTVYPH
jgi:hypothetical protein